MESFSKERVKAIKLYKEFIRKPLKSDDKEYPLEIFRGIVAGSKLLYEKVLTKFGKNKRKELKSKLKK